MHVRYKNIWDKLPEPKAEYHNFYNRISTWRYTVAEAAQPWIITRDRRSEKRIFYDEYEGEKVWWSMFDKRVTYLGMTFEEAIKKNKKMKSTLLPKYSFNTTKVKTHAQVLKERENKSYKLIEVTMKVEEAKVYHSVYRKLIEELEQEINQLEDTVRLKELETKLKNLQQEYQVFLSFNPISSWLKN